MGWWLPRTLAIPAQDGSGPRPVSLLTVKDPASALFAGNRLYVGNLDGRMTVLRAGRPIRCLHGDGAHLDFVSNPNDLRRVAEMVQEALGVGAYQVALFGINALLYAMTH